MPLLDRCAAMDHLSLGVEALLQAYGQVGDDFLELGECQDALMLFVDHFAYLFQHFELARFNRLAVVYSKVLTGVIAYLLEMRKGGQDGPPSFHAIEFLDLFLHVLDVFPI